MAVAELELAIVNTNEIGTSEDNLIIPAEVLIPIGDNQMRSISSRVITGQVEITKEQRAASVNWTKNISDHTCLESGDVLAISEAGTKKFPVSKSLISAAHKILKANGIDVNAAECENVPLCCTGVAFHNDIMCFAKDVFCVVWTSEDAGMDLVFPHIGKRVPLVMGAVVVFDGGLPHGVVRRGETEYRPEQFTGMALQTFVSIDVPTDHACVQKTMGIVQQHESMEWDGIRLGIDATAEIIDVKNGAWSLQ